jgi:hypothetical protein
MASGENGIQIALFAFVVVVAIAAVLYLWPRYFYGNLRRKEDEGFTTIALSRETFPKCFARSPDAQELLNLLRTSKMGMPPASDAGMAYNEFSMILQKVLCMDADITSLGAGAYSTYSLPFNTLHDMEPVGSFVSRCLKNAIKSRDVEITFGKLHYRGNQLIATMCGNDHSMGTALTLFDRILANARKNITAVCLKEHATMDVPAGVRDPGYYTPPELTQLSAYQETGTIYKFN